MPRRFSDGRYLFGYSKYTDISSEYERQDSHIYFARLENIDDDPLPCDLITTNLPDDENGITVPAGANGSVAQEPSIAELPDGRLICTLRNIQGSVYYTVSSDMGHTWRAPEPMCFDDGSRIVHPLSPCPIYRLDEQRYILLFHGRVSEDGIWFPRNPIRKVYGTFSPDSHQPIRFKKGSDEVLMTLPEQAHAVGQFGLAMYGSHTKIQGRDILWYPDRKFFLLGKEI